MILDFLQKSKTITTSEELQRALGGGYSSVSGMTVTADTAMRFAPVFACIRVLSEAMGSLPFNLFERNGDNSNKAVDDQLYWLLSQAPNDYLSSQEWIEMLVVHLCLRGNHYSWINRINGVVKELLPLNPDAVNVRQLHDWTVVYDVTFPDGTTSTLSSNEIFHVRNITSDGLEGMTPIQVRNSIGLGLAAEKFGSALFKNGAKISGLLSTEANMPPETRREMANDWNEMHGGSDQLKTAVLSGGLKWTAVSISPEDAQFLETRKFQRSEIAGIFRVPAHMINDMEKSTFGNIEHQDRAFAVHSLAPIARRIEQRVVLSLLPIKDRKKKYAKFNMNALMRGDMKTRADYFWKRFQMGSLSPNDIRELEDENPIVGGDTYWIPSNMMDPKDETEMQQIGGDDNG